MTRYNLNDIAIVIFRGRIKIVPLSKLSNHEAEGEQRIIPIDWDQSDLHKVFLYWVMHAVCYVPDTDQVYATFFKIREFNELLGMGIVADDEAQMNAANRRTAARSAQWVNHSGQTSA